MAFSLTAQLVPKSEDTDLVQWGFSLMKEWFLVFSASLQRLTQSLYLNGYLVAVIADGQGLVTLRLPLGLCCFFCCWEITRIGKLSLDFLNCSSGCLKPTPEFLKAFYKYPTLHEPQVLTKTPFNLLCYVWFAFRFSVLCLFLMNASEQSVCIPGWCTGSCILEPVI